MSSNGIKKVVNNKVPQRKRNKRYTEEREMKYRTEFEFGPVHS